MMKLVFAAVTADRKQRIEGYADGPRFSYKKWRGRHKMVFSAFANREHFRRHLAKFLVDSKTIDQTEYAITTDALDVTGEVAGVPEHQLYPIERIREVAAKPWR